MSYNYFVCMSNLANLLTGQKVLAEAFSPINGKLTVIRDLSWGTHIMAGGVTQSGGVAEKIWRAALKRIKDRKKIEKVLILGLGGGSIAKLIREFWGEEVEIVGVEIDPIMVSLGEKYMGLKENKVETYIKDAFEFCQEEIDKNRKYDLICMDVYVKHDVPEKFASLKFLKMVKRLIAKDGMAIFNRLYYDQKKAQAMELYRKLETVFTKAEILHPESDLIANIVFICLP